MSDTAINWAEEPLTVEIVKGAWTPFSADVATEHLGWPVERVREEFGDTVLIRFTGTGFECRRPDPAPDSPEIKAEVGRILGGATRDDLAAMRAEIERTNRRIELATHAFAYGPI